MAMRRVPSRSFSRGTRFLRIWLVLRRRTTQRDMRTTRGKVLLKLAIGASTSVFDSLNTTVHFGTRKLNFKGMD